ncbi:MAG: hypothetical protein ACREA7_09125 [Nitrosotalea sp.]
MSIVRLGIVQSRYYKMAERKPTPFRIGRMSEKGTGSLDENMTTIHIVRRANKPGDDFRH